jgi:hypothetical protein
MRDSGMSDKESAPARGGATGELRAAQGQPDDMQVRAPT